MTRLFFLHMTGCEACEQQTPRIDAFEAAHPEVKVVRVDLAFEAWEARGWTPKITPTMVITAPGLKKPSVWEGLATTEQMESWYSTVRSKL